MTDCIEIRLATQDDLPAVLDIVRRVVPLMLAEGNRQWGLDYPNAEVLGRDIEKEQLWVATMGNAATIVGLAAVTSAREPEYERLDGWAGGAAAPAVVVHRLATHPDWRGRGVAAALMQQAERVAAGLGTSFVRVDTNSETTATQKFFPKLGFSYVGEIALDLRPGQRFLCYEKVLR